MFPESKLSFAFYISVICAYIVTICSVQTLSSFRNLGMGYYIFTADLCVCIMMLIIISLSGY